MLLLKNVEQRKRVWEEWIWLFVTLQHSGVALAGGKEQESSNHGFIPCLGSTFLPAVRLWWVLCQAAMCSPCRAPGISIHSHIHSNTFPSQYIPIIHWISAKYLPVQGCAGEHSTGSPLRAGPQPAAPQEHWAASWSWGLSPGVSTEPWDLFLVSSKVCKIFQVFLAKLKKTARSWFEAQPNRVI